MRTSTAIIVGILVTLAGIVLVVAAIVRTDGFQRLGPGFTDTSVVAELSPGTDRATVVEGLQARLGATAETVKDWRGNVESEIASDLSTVPVVAAAITVLTVVMTALVVGLVVGAALRTARRSMGVCRALGFTSGQLMRQTLWEHMPMLGVGAALGAVLGAVTLNPLLGLVLRSLGAALVGLPVVPGRAALIALGSSPWPGRRRRSPARASGVWAPPSSCRRRAEPSAWPTRVPPRRRR